MKQNLKWRRGFSLMEVNMAIFVMSVGVLSVVILYSLGLRESVQSHSDMRQSVFADYMLNALVSAACSPTVTRAEWDAWANQYPLEGMAAGALVSKLDQSVPPFLEEAMNNAKNNCGDARGETLSQNQSYAVYCVPVPGYSGQVMGIMVRSLADMDAAFLSVNERIRRLEVQPVFYAEARFQGAF